MEPPIKIGELELSAPITDIELSPGPDGQAYTAVRMLVRMYRDPVGHVYLTPGQLDAATVRAEIWRQLGAAVNQHRAEAGQFFFGSRDGRLVPVRPFPRLRTCAGARREGVGAGRSN